MSSLADATPANRKWSARARKTRPAVRRRYVPLLHRVVAINALLVIVAVAVTIVVLAPGKVSAFAVDEEVAVVLIAVLLVVAANVYLLRRVLGPVQALTGLARQVDLTTLKPRLPDAEAGSEAGELALTFNEMLSRLEAERRDSSTRVLRAQEAERLRIAQANVAQHSGSKCATVKIEHWAGRLVLTVLDCGRGLPPGTSPGTGVCGMGERAAVIGASLHIGNRRSGLGCEVRLEVPLEEDA
ncbi:MAG: HAMP domain-containing protein [Solirubrobacterales bacterium]|nr:HAMP domain-containing protein [Solirubrobacterales bacterium]